MRYAPALMKVITDTQSLTEFSAALRQKPAFAVDTEFMREKTYWPVLCLIQAAADDLEAIIDPLADGLDLTPFLDAMADTNVVKVFHAARQDLEIFYRFMGALPAPIFDTQIAAMACGYGDQIGYEPLMRDLLGAQIDKGSRFTDWSRRPLTNAQLSYAMSDVTHLHKAYGLMTTRLKEQNRMSWVEEELETLTDPGLYFVEPAKAWKRLKLRNVRPKDLGPLMKIAQWRESEAQARDVPRARVLKDDAIFELARLQPQTTKDLSRARAISSGFERSRAGASLLEAVKSGLDMPKEALPNLNQSRPSAPPPADVVDLLRVLLKRQCEHYGVAPKLIASSADIEAIATHDEADVRALRGWRREVYGEQALKLKRGELALKLNNDAIEIIES